MIVCPFLRDECTPQCALYDRAHGCQLSRIASISSEPSVHVAGEELLTDERRPLTRQVNGVAYCNAACPPGSDGTSDKCDSCPHHAMMIDRLAEYEILLANSEVDTLKEVLKAYDDGRVVILPVKPGDALYMPISDEFDNMIHYTFTGHVLLAVDLPGNGGRHTIPVSVIGKNVFTSLADAVQRGEKLYGRRKA